MFAVVLAGTTLVVTLGASALTDTRSGLDTSRAEKALTQFDSRSAMVALGGTSHQGVDLATGSGADYRVADDAGWMNVTVYNSTADNHTTLVNATLGAVVYENGPDTIAYQGGGVWKRTESGVTMLSPPEFHFRAATLTLPIVTVGGGPDVGPSAEVVKSGETTVLYPNATEDTNFTNPLENGRVNVTVRSEHYEAWGEYFLERTEGNVFYDHENETVRAELVVPFNEEFDNAVATTASGGINVNGDDPKPSPSETGLNYPSADDRIEDRIDDCESGACDTTTPLDGITDEGTYYVNGDFSGDIDVSSPDGNVTIVVNGDFEPSSVAVDQDTSNSTQVLVRENVAISGSSGAHSAQPGQFVIVMHSEGEFDMNGNSNLDAFLYAPESTCDMNGNAFIVGGSVCETMDINGNPNDFTYDSSVENVDLQLKNDITAVTYLHVTVNSVNVTSG